MPSQDSVTRAVDALSKSDVKSEAEKTPNLGDVDDLNKQPQLYNRYGSLAST